MICLRPLALSGRVGLHLRHPPPLRHHPGQVLRHQRPFEVPHQDERQESGLPDNHCLGLLQLHLLPCHRLVETGSGR